MGVLLASTAGLAASLVRTPVGHAQAIEAQAIEAPSIAAQAIEAPSVEASTVDRPMIAARAAEPTDERRVTFEDAIALAEQTPELAASRAALEARRHGDARISDFHESLRIYLMPGIRALTESARGFEGQVQLGFSHNLGELGSAQRRTAAHERAALDARSRTLTLSQRVVAASAWIALRAAELGTEVASETLAAARDLRDRTRRAADAGVLTEADAVEAETFVAEAESLRLALEGTRIEARIGLATAMARTEVDALATRGEWPSVELPETETLEARLRSVEQLPAVLAEQARVAALRERGRELDAEQAPRLDADVMVYRESPGGLMIFGQVGLSFGVTDRQARARATIDEERELAAGAVEALREQALREAHRLAHDVEHARHAEGALAEHLVPELERLVALRERQLAAGQVTIFVALDARRRALAASLRLASARAERARAETHAAIWLAAIESSERP